jgi:hypothetical protein
MRKGIVWVALVMTAGTAWAGGYEMADLQALEKQGSNMELVSHLGDIPPSKRDKKWNDMAERAATAWLASLKVSEDDTDQPLQAAEAVLRSVPMLGQSKVFMAKRAEMGLKSFQWNYSHYRHATGDDKWIDLMLEFVKADKVTPDLPMRAAKLVESRLVAQCAYPFFKMVYDKQGPSLCKDPGFQKMIVSAFGYGSWLKEITDIAQNKCWGDLKAPLVAELVATKSESYREHTCPVLKAKNAIPADHKADCEAP